ncbi:MAG: hypothetical protein NT045_03610, partial [Candidatus Aureabacteria bacterium]|nr:hypothetical protein [Candidatus Auribacterota bacterium]
KWECYFIPAANVWHKVSRTTGGESSPFMSYLWTRNWLLLSRKHIALVKWPILYAAYVRECYWLYQGLRQDGKPRSAEATLAGMWAALVNRFGAPPDEFSPPRWLGRLADRDYRKRGGTG